VIRAVVLACLIFLTACTTPKSIHPPDAALRAKQTEMFTARVKELGKNGDWLVTRGYHFADDLVATVTNIPLSHVAVLDMDNDQVIEAEGKGVHSTKLKDFVDKSHRVLLIRPMWAQGNAAEDAVVIARKLIGKKYDFLGTIGINDSKRFYCSELAIFIYKKYQKEIDHIPKIIEPGQMYLWGQVLYDSRPRN